MWENESAKKSWLTSTRFKTSCTQKLNACSRMKTCSNVWLTKMKPWSGSSKTSSSCQMRHSWMASGLVRSLALRLSSWNKCSSKTRPTVCRWKRTVTWPSTCSRICCMTGSSSTLTLTSPTSISIESPRPSSATTNSLSTATPSTPTTCTSTTASLCFPKGLMQTTSREARTPGNASSMLTRCTSISPLTQPRRTAMGYLWLLTFWTMNSDRITGTISYISTTGFWRPGNGLRQISEGFMSTFGAIWGMI